MDNRINKEQRGEEQEIVDFESEMPQISSDDVEFIPDDKLEEDIVEETDEI